MDRRHFLASSFIGFQAAAGLQGQPAKRILIETVPNPAPLRKLAERELLRGLRGLSLKASPRLATRATTAMAGDITLSLRLDPGTGTTPESFEIASSAGKLTFTARDDRSLLYAIYDFFERQGVFYGIDGESFPFDPSGDLIVPPDNAPWTGAPRFATRGLLPWPDFLNCITVYNDEDFRAYFESMLRMRFNMFGMHVYTGATQWAESYLSYEFAGVGHLAFLDTTASHRWGYLPQRTSRYGMGAPDFFAGESFGSDATFGMDPWEIAENTRALLRRAFDHAARLGIKTGIGFEPYQLPDEIWRALPPEVKPEQLPGRKTNAPRVDPESVAAKDMLEARLANLLESYPQADYIYLWEDENMSWESRKLGMPLSITPFLQAHDFLRRHAPNKRLVVGGWGGVARNFEEFHRRLPEDIIFTCLSDSLGWDPVHEVFGRLEKRERWPIPWLEDDPAMWIPQFRVERFEMDMNRAEEFGCQGMLGIHWRHRIVDPTAGYFARACWKGQPSISNYYNAYARTQAAGPRAAKLAGILEEFDRKRTILCTWTGEIKDEHAVIREWSGDYSEGFTFWNKYEPDLAVLESQKQVAAELGALLKKGSSAQEMERLDHLVGHVEMLVPYAESWRLAHRIHQLLKDADDLRKKGRKDDARFKVLNEAMPLWMELAPLVRETMLRFQSVVATRNDLGTLASMQNKYVRLALTRLRLSMKEFLRELPPESEDLVRKATAPSDAPLRLFLPTRPTLLGKGESVRLFLVAPGGKMPAKVSLFLRPHGVPRWREIPAKLVARRTWQAQLGPFDGTAPLVDYYARADAQTAPADAPKSFYTMTLS